MVLKAFGLTIRNPEKRNFTTHTSGYCLYIGFGVSFWARLCVAGPRYRPARVASALLEKESGDQSPHSEVWVLALLPNLS